MAARAAQLALFIVEFAATTRTPTPVIGLAIAGNAVFLRLEFIAAGMNPHGQWSSKDNLPRGVVHQA